MARGLTNALQLALSAASGGLQGYGAKQQRLQKEEQMRLALERQKEQDAMDMALKSAELSERGWMQAPAFETQRKAAGLGVGSTLASALNAASGGMPMAPQGDLEPASRGILTAAPAGEITFGGKRLVLPETQTMRQERLGRVAASQAEQKARAEQERQQTELAQTTALIQKSYRTADGKPLSAEQARYAAQSGKNPIDLGLVEKPMTAAERARLGLDRERLGLERERLGLEREKAGPGSATRAQNILATNTPPSPDEIAFLKEFMPTPIRDVQGNITGYKPAKRNIGRVAAFGGRMSGAAGAQGELGYMIAGDDMARLSNILNKVADRQAAREEGGRLSEGDILRRRDQVNIRTGDVRDNARKYQKLNQALMWAELDQQPQDRQPVETPRSQVNVTPSDATVMAQDPDYIEGMNAIARGANKAAVIARYESTGKKWPGGR